MYGHLLQSEIHRSFMFFAWFFCPPQVIHMTYLLCHNVSCTFTGSLQYILSFLQCDRCFICLVFTSIYKLLFFPLNLTFFFNSAFFKLCHAVLCIFFQLFLLLQSLLLCLQCSCNTSCKSDVQKPSVSLGLAM